MGLEDLTGASKFIDDLVNTNPTSGDAPSAGDDHIRGVKNVLLNSFPGITGAVTATHTELNYTDVTTAGTAEASKALIADASKDISGINALGCASQTITSTDAGASLGPTLTLDRNSASPAASDVIGGVTFKGRDSGSNEATYARIYAQIVDATDTSEDGRLAIQTVIGGSFGIRGYIQEGIVWGSPTGLDKGAGTINAQAVYDDNVLLTCYVFDAAVNGSIDVDKWNAKAPSGDHAPMKKFKSRLNGPENPLDIDKYAEHWKTKKHLTSMPNEASFNHGDMPTGEWIQRLIETVEIQAVLLEQLNQRVKTLESAN